MVLENRVIIKKSSIFKDMIEDTRVFQKSDTAIFRVIDGKTFILTVDGNQKSEEVITCNATAARIWDLINGKRTISKIVVRIVGEFAIEKEAALEKISDFIKQLKKNKLVKQV